MPACRRWHDRLLDYTLSALDAPAVQEVEAHLNACSACAAAVVELRTRGEQLAAALPQLVADAEPSPAFRARVLAAIEHEPGLPLSVPAWAGALAAVVVLALAGFVLRPPEEPWADRTASDVTALSTWRSPTESLLRSPGDALLTTTPRLGEFYFPLEPAPASAGEPNGGNNES